MKVGSKKYYDKEIIQYETMASNHTSIVEQVYANAEAMERDSQEILRIGMGQKRLCKVYEERCKLSKAIVIKKF